jgi:hypothetical protein
MRRLQKAAAGHKLTFESVEDDLLDLAVYVAIALVLYRDENYNTEVLPDAPLKNQSTLPDIGDFYRVVFT